MSEPEPETSELLRERREKLERLRGAGLDPFPHTFPEREEIGEVRRAHEGLTAGGETESWHRVAGRIVARRGHGKAAFFDLRDASGDIQLHARRTSSARTASSSSSASTSATSSGSRASPSRPSAAS